MSGIISIEESQNIFVYKLIADNGGAPCIHKGVLSLSICKPRIRQSAQVDDWIIGFGGKSIPDLRGRLIYIAQVTEVVEHGDYYAVDKYKNRPDCIYKRIGNEYKFVEGKRFHGPDDVTHDLGAAPSFDRARTLLSDRFVYFGREGDGSIIKPVSDLYDGLPRDFVKNHADDSRERFEGFIQAIFDQYGSMPPGRPTHAEISASYLDNEEDFQVISRCNSK